MLPTIFAGPYFDIVVEVQKPGKVKEGVILQNLQDPLDIRLKQTRNYFH